MDLSRIDLIPKCNNKSLLNESFLESLIPELGTNDEIIHEQPSIVTSMTGGLKIWQYPNQFSKYMVRVLAGFPIKTYLEIGCRWGGTFVLTMEYLSRVQKDQDITGVAVDIIDSPVLEYCKQNAGASFMKCDSSSPEFKNYLTDKQFDLVLIDGDHSYTGVVADFQLIRDKAGIVVFHDIFSSVCPGVVQCWQEVKQMTDIYDFHEFVDQYDEVVRATGCTYLGIGVAVKRTPYTGKA